MHMERQNNFKVKVNVTLNCNKRTIQHPVVLFNYGLIFRSICGYKNPCQVIKTEDRK